MLKLFGLLLMVGGLILNPGHAIAQQTPPATKPSVTQTAVSIPTPDSVQLKGTLYTPASNVSDVAVIFSNTGESKQSDWAMMAEAVANRGHLAITYDFRFWVSRTRRDPNLFDKAADDLQAVIDYAFMQGAKRVVLIGASLGGMATAKAGIRKGVAGIVVISSPMSAQGLKMQVLPEELSATIPKLFIASKEDKTVAASETQKMFDTAAEPKQLILYLGSAHGTDIFKTDDAEDLTAQLHKFIAASVLPVTATLAATKTP